MLNCTNRTIYYKCSRIMLHDSRRGLLFEGSFGLSSLAAAAARFLAATVT